MFFKKTIKEAPKLLVEGIAGLILKPPKIAIEAGAKLKGAYDKMSPEDKELLKEAAISAARLTARAVIAADKGGKVEF